MMKSPRMLAAALEYQKAVRLIQVPGMVWSNVRAIGVHWKMVATMLATAYPTTKTSIPCTNFRKDFFGKMRKYRSKMEALVKLMATLYMSWIAQKPCIKVRYVLSRNWSLHISYLQGYVYIRLGKVDPLFAIAEVDT